MRVIRFMGGINTTWVVVSKGMKGQRTGAEVTQGNQTLLGMNPFTRGNPTIIELPLAKE